MEIDLTTFKTYIPDVTLSDTTIQQYLNDAKQDITRDGIPTTHQDFEYLQRLYAMGLMQTDKVDGIQSLTSSGVAPEGISSIGLQGLNIGFSGSSGNATSIDKQTGKAGYMARYQETLRKIRAYKGRIT